MYITSVQFIIYRGNFPFFTKIKNSQFLTRDEKSKGFLSKMYKIIPNSFRLFFYTFTIKYQAFLEKWCINGLNILQLSVQNVEKGIFWGLGMYIKILKKYKMCRVCQKLHFNKQFDVVEAKLKKGPCLKIVKNMCFWGVFWKLVDC